MGLGSGGLVNQRANVALTYKLQPRSSVLALSGRERERKQRQNQARHIRIFGPCCFLDFGRMAERRLEERRLEARTGVEPVNKGFADLCLTTWLPRRLTSRGLGRLVSASLR